MGHIELMTESFSCHFLYTREEHWLVCFENLSHFTRMYQPAQYFGDFPYSNVNFAYIVFYSDYFDP